MIKKKFIIIVLFLTSLSLSAKNIDRDSTISISGQIVASKSFSPIPLSHIIIKGKRSGQICDNLGVFHIQIKQSDTLVISALGHKTLEWTIPYIFDTKFSSFFQISLEEMAYLLNEVDVFALGTWDDFKKNFRELELKDDFAINKQITAELAPFNTRPPNIIPPQYRTTIEDPGVWDAIGNPASFLFTKFNSKEKSKRKVSNMMRNEWRTKKYAKYYTSDIVSAHTGLKDEALEDFMAYCGPKLEITEITSQYDILEQIVKNHKVYLKQSKSK